MIDIGGPGAAPLGAAYPRALVGAQSAVNVLVIDEPWTTAGRLPDCDAALTSWYDDLRAHWPQGAGDASVAAVRSQCRLFEHQDRWNLTPQTYRTLVRDIARHEHLDLVSFYGFSFGSARWAASADLFHDGILVSPFPVGMPATQYLDIRAATRSPLVGRAIVGARTSGRSLSLSGLDADAARLESLYLDPAARRALFTGTDTAAVVGRLSDQLFGRYATDSLSHAILAYWDGTCASLTQWNAVSATDKYGLLGELLRVCGDQDGAPDPEVPADLATPACVATVRADGIVPPVATAWSAERGGWPRPLTVSGGHANSRGLTACLRALGG